MTPARAADVVHRERGWPSIDLDLLAVMDRLQRFLPVGFYYKIGLRPRWLWPRVEPLVRRAAGHGNADLNSVPVDRERRNLHCDLLVIGGGVAGLSAALAADEAGMSVVLCDEWRLGERHVPGAAADLVRNLGDELRVRNDVTILEQSPAIGIYEGPLAVINSPDFLQLVHPSRIVVATGAVEAHDVFLGSDMPGVWLGRAAAQMVSLHGLAVGRKAVVVGAHHEVADQLGVLEQSGVEAVAVGNATVRRATGRKGVETVHIDGRGEIRCDAVVLARSFTPRDSLLRQGADLQVVGAGQVVYPSCSLAEAQESGRRAALGETVEARDTPLPRIADAGFVCLCEDVRVADLERAWREGFQSTEILKRYSTVTMGPCRGVLCHDHLRAFAEKRLGTGSSAAGPTTARPPARDVTVEEIAAGERTELFQRTSLHERHLELGATMEPAGLWQRPERYGDVSAEYSAVRHAVSVMDVGTLGKFVVSGPDALEFLERLYPCRVDDLEPGRIRYALLLGQHGYVIDDGVICALGEGRYYLTLTSGGAAHAEAHLREWADTWGYRVYILNRTAALGAINLAGPRARDLLASLCRQPVDNDHLPYLRHREIDVAGVSCRAIRLGFVGELSFELHHPSSRSVELWDSLLSAGDDLGIRPHGLEALRLLRLEKGHIIVGQDTDFDSTPAKLGMNWAVKMDKEYFLGRTALTRLSARPVESQLVTLRFEGEAPPEGSPLSALGEMVGYLTSSRNSPVLGCGIGLGWTQRLNGEFPQLFDVRGVTAVAVKQPPYDPEGLRPRA
jgi:sarcosine oxidase, subunit alpha